MNNVHALQKYPFGDNQKLFLKGGAVLLVLFLGMANLYASPTFFSNATESTATNTAAIVAKEFKITQVKARREVLQNAHDGLFIVFHNDNEFKSNTYTLLYNSVADKKKQFRKTELSGNPLLVSGIAPGQYHNFIIIKESNEETSTKYTESVEIIGGIRIVESGEEQCSITPNIRQHLSQAKQSFNQDYAPNKYNLITYQNQQEKYVFRDNFIEYFPFIKTNEAVKVDIQLINSNPKASMEANAFIRKNKKAIHNEAMRNVLQIEELEVFEYQELYYNNIYPSIDARFYADANQNVYVDFIAHPKANLQSIELNCVGKFNQTSLDKNKQQIYFTIQETAENRVTLAQQITNAYQISNDLKVPITVNFAKVGETHYQLSTLGNHPVKVPTIITIKLAAEQ